MIGNISHMANLPVTRYALPVTGYIKQGLELNPVLSPIVIFWLEN